MTKHAMRYLGLFGIMLIGWFWWHARLHHHGPLQPAYAQSEPGPTVVTHHETIPNPVFGSLLRVTDQCKAVQTPCAWEATGTWTTGTLPDRDSRVIIDGFVQINQATALAHAVGIYPGGELRFNPAANTQLQSGDIGVFAGGVLTIGTVEQPIGDDYTAQVILRDLPFEANDPKQHLRGIVVVDGTLSMHGHTLPETFIRTMAEPQQGATTIHLTTSALAAGWQVGDDVVLPKSSQCPIATTQGTCPDETEDHTIAAIAADGLSLTLAEPLQFVHPGARNNQGQLDFLPHVLNKSRNVIIRSENPHGVRGHILLHGRALVDLRYARLQDLGRTDIRNLGDDNQKGRYPLHAHHLIGPVATPTNGYQYTLVGNVIDFGAANRTQNRKWGISLHNSHFGLVAQNIVDYASGAGLVTEDGTETGNHLLRNFVVRVIGGNNERSEDRDPSDNTKLGRAGVAYWFNGGGGNQIVENIAAAVAECTSCYGFKIDNVYNGDLLLPTSRGADPQHGGVLTSSYTIGLTAFVRNEAYAVPNGLTIWWVCTDYEIPIDSCSSTVQEFRVWHNHRWGYFAYETNQMTLDHFTMRGDASLLTNPYEALIGLYLVDYFQRRTVIRHADIQGAATAIEAPVHRDIRGTSGPDVGITVIEDSLLIAGTGIYITSPSTTNGSDDLAPQTTLIRNVQFAHPSTRPGANIVINGDGSTSATSNNPELRNDVRIINYNRAPGQRGDNLYIVPTYQEPSRCDAALGDCSTDLSANYSDITGGRVYALAASAVPTPLPTPSPSPAPTKTALPTDADQLYLPVVIR